MKTVREKPKRMSKTKRVCFYTADCANFGAILWDIVNPHLGLGSGLGSGLGLGLGLDSVRGSTIYPIR